MTQVPTLASQRQTRSAAQSVPLRRLIGRAILYLVLVAGALVLLVPFYWLVTTAFKEPYEAVLFPPHWIPSSWHPENIPAALQYMRFPLLLRNSVLITTVALTGILLSSSLAGFSFGRLHWPLRDPLFVVVLATLMLPYQTVIVPQFILFQNLGWINTFLPLTVPAFLGGGAFNIFLTRQFVMTLPLELDDAARIDGASSFRIWAQLVLPLTKPVLATIFMFSFIGTWHDFLGPLIYLNTDKLWTLELGLRAMSQYSSARQNLPQVAFQTAASMVIMIPPLVVFFVAQRFLKQGVVMSGVTG